MIKTYSQFLNESHTEDWLSRQAYSVYETPYRRPYKISEKGVEVFGNIEILDNEITEFPVKFTKVGGSFTCTKTKIESLKGFPEQVLGAVNLADNYFLKSLEGMENSHVKQTLFLKGNTSLWNLWGFPKSWTAKTWDYKKCYLGYTNLISILYYPDLDNIENLVFGETKCYQFYIDNGFWNTKLTPDERMKIHADCLVEMSKKYKKKVVEFLDIIRTKDTPTYSQLVEHNSTLLEFRGEDVKQAYDTSKNVEGDFY